jgi:hypothetical protein
MEDAGNKQNSAVFASANRGVMSASGGYSISRVKRRFNMR